MKTERLVRLAPGVLAVVCVGLFVSGGLAVVQAAGGAARPEGPCDLYAKGGTPCVAAHSTTRALYAAYQGPLYQVKRTGDGKTLDIRVMGPRKGDGGGYADAPAQDAFCAGVLCVINRIYDQSGKGNHLYQAPPGPLFPGPEKGAFDTQPLADMAPVTVGGHKVYGVYIMPGMGLRNNDARDLAVGDEAEGIYYVVDGTHFDSGCCFDYGNASTNGLAVGTGTMETTYFGTSTVWGRGRGAGPWIMADLEAGLFSGYDAKVNEGDPAIDAWRFVTAVVNGGGGNKWELRGGNAQTGKLATYYDGVRPGSKTGNAYYPMHKQGAILLGTGGDNGNGSSGTFYEGVMTQGYPTDATTDAVQANVVAARYALAPVALSRVTTLQPGSEKTVTVTFTNTGKTAAKGARLTASAPKGWKVTVEKALPGTVAAGAQATATLRVTSSSGGPLAGELAARVVWSGEAGKQTEAAWSRVRSAPPVKINEVGLGTVAAPQGQFIELYNAGTVAVDVSNWRLVHRPSQWNPVRLAEIPAGTKIAPKGFYVLGLTESGLAAPAQAGDTVVQLRSVAGLTAGQQIDIDGEMRTVSKAGSAATAATTVFIPVSLISEAGPWLKVQAGATKIPVTSAAGFEAGQKLGIDAGGRFETATVTAVGKAATQTVLAAAVTAGATAMSVKAAANLSAGDEVTVGTGANKETAQVAGVGVAENGATPVRLAGALKKAHGVGVDVSSPGTGVTVTPGLKFGHESGDAVQALGSGVTLDRPLTKAHGIGAPVRPGGVTPQVPGQGFGAVLSPRAGSIALTDASGAVLVDGIVYGSQQSNSSANGTIASPEIATLEGEQGQGGCIAVVPPPAGNGLRSLGRFPDGEDQDSLCRDFRTQPGAALPVGAEAGSETLRVTSVNGFAAGQKVVIDAGANRETAMVAAVGAAGAGTMTAAAEAGANLVVVTAGGGFQAGQTVSVGRGAEAETVAVASAANSRAGTRLTLAGKLGRAHAAGTVVAGSGITLTGKLGRTHAAGSGVVAGESTAGAANEFGGGAK